MWKFSSRRPKKVRPKLRLESLEDRYTPAAPVITSLGGGATASVSRVENTYDVTTVTATDADAGTTLTYSIAGGADAARFAINRATGVLTFAAAPNFELPSDSGANNVYDVTVRVSDGSSTDTQAIAVAVTNDTSEAAGKSPVLQIPYRANTNVSSVDRLYKSAAYKIEVKRAGTSDAYTESFAFESRNDVIYYNTYGSGDPNLITHQATDYGNGKSDQRTASFTSFSFKDTAVDVRITMLGSRVANSVTVRPLRFGMTPTISPDKKVITFRLDSPRKVSVEVNDRLNPLFLFSDAPDQPDPGATYYYGPGLHRIGGTGELTVRSNERVYVAPGAIVEGRFGIAAGSTNVTIRGRGIVSGGEVRHPPGNDYRDLKAIAAVHSEYTNKFTLEGLTFVQSPAYNIAIEDNSGTTSGTYDNIYRNLKLLSWDRNTDAFWVTGNNNRLEDTFIFNNDDAVVNKGGTGTVVNGLTVWGGVSGRLLLYHFVGDVYRTVKNFTFENVDYIGKEGDPRVLHIQTDGKQGRSVENSVIRNVRVEERRRPGNTNNTSYNKARLLEFGGTEHPVIISGMLLENIHLDQKLPSEGFLSGSSSHPFTNVRFKNLTMGGQLILSAAAANISVSGNVQVQWLSPNAAPTNVLLNGRATDVTISASNATAG
jgi:hypothetical protein